jgi:ATP-dependent Lon protease
VNRQVSIAAVQHAMREGQQIGVLMQRDPKVQEPSPADLHRIGTVANILRMVTTPDGTHQLVCQGVQRFRVLDWGANGPSSPPACTGSRSRTPARRRWRRASST